MIIRSIDKNNNKINELHLINKELIYQIRRNTNKKYRLKN